MKKLTAKRAKRVTRAQEMAVGRDRFYKAIKADKRFRCLTDKDIEDLLTTHVTHRGNGLREYELLDCTPEQQTYADLYFVGRKVLKEDLARWRYRAEVWTPAWVRAIENTLSIFK